MLKYLRYPDKTRSLWVDAICINQGDIPEKNTQVPRMADIFRLAERVVVWLGAESDNSTLALSTLDYLAAQVEITKASWTWPSPGSAHQDWFHSLTDMPCDDNTWQAIADLANRPISADCGLCKRSIFPTTKRPCNADHTRSHGNGSAGQFSASCGKEISLTRFP